MPKLIDFPEAHIVFAKNQPQYMPMPAYSPRDETGMVIFCWQLNWLERLTVLVTGRLWHSVLTFNQILQPQLINVGKPVMPMDDTRKAERVMSMKL